MSELYEKIDRLLLSNSWMLRGLVTIGCTIGTLFAVRLHLNSKRKSCTNNILLNGKTCIVTGANRGIGLAVATELARRGAIVILACRDVQKGSKAALKIRRAVKKEVDLSVYSLNLSSFYSIRQFVFEINRNSIDVDFLVNNAGIMGCPFTKSEDGNELHFAVNHLGHFLLTNLLLPQMKNKKDARIVNVSSALYKNTESGFLLNFNEEKGYNPSQAYASSKLANILFARELSKRLPEGITINAMHPGLVRTNLARYRLGNNHSLKCLWKVFGFFFLRTPKQGAETIIQMITDERLRGVSGKYFGNCTKEELLPIAMDSTLSEKLWEMSERLTGLKSEARN